MSTRSIPITESDGNRVQEFAGRLFMACLGALELTNIDMGVRLGLYAALADRGALTPGELAQAAGIHARYAQEWLEQQAAAGILEVEGAERAAAERRYTLPTAHAHVLLDDSSMAFMAPAADFVRVAGRAQELVEKAFRSGGGVPFSAYDIDELQAGFTKPTFTNLLASQWIPALPDVHEKLKSGSAHVAEIGAGHGWAAISLARAFPGIRIDAFDLDEASVEKARKNAAGAGVGDRVTFELRDVAGSLPERSYDFVFAVEVIHDVPDPVGLLGAMRRMRSPQGAVLVADEKAHESFRAPADEMERLFYAASVLHCLPVGMTKAGSAGTGTCIRPETMKRYASQAGFTGVETLPVEHPQFRLYRLVG